MTPPMDELLDLAVRAAHAAGELLLERFRRPVGGVGTKSSGTDMVSDADRDSESLIVGLISTERPNDAILAEESGQGGGSGGLRWVIDPLDGTTNFLYGIHQWAVSIACEDDAGTLAGVVYAPCLDETFAAVRGAGATLNKQAIHVSRLTDVGTALVATGFAYTPEERSAWGRVVHGLLPRVRDIRRPGSAATDLAWAAAGRVDAYAEIPCAQWDRTAGMLIVAEAGGTTGMLPALGPSGEGVIAAPPVLYRPLLAMIEDLLAGGT
jgi:myo-inositol-1(or 4)-monophosphatase